MVRDMVVEEAVVDLDLAVVEVGEDLEIEDSEEVESHLEEEGAIWEALVGAVVEATWEDSVETEEVLVEAVEALEAEEVLETEVEDLVAGTQRNI